MPRRPGYRALGGSTAVGLLLLSLTQSAKAIETAPLDGEAVLVDITESASVLVNVDNRNTRAANVSSETDDDWAMAYNRLDSQASWSNFRLHLRLDSALYLTSRSPSEVALALLEQERRERQGEPYSSEDSAYFVRKFYEAGDELSTRFVNWTYPAKYSVGYETRNLDVTAGDFYAQFGQGLVLSVRKRDELSSDTTIRGLRVSGKLEHDELRLKATALAGTLNPLRIDDRSGRTLGVNGNSFNALADVTEAGMPRAISNDFVPTALPNYAPDQVLGAELEARFSKVGVALQGTRLSRACVPGPDGCVALGSDLVRAARTIDTGGISVDMPQLGEHFAVYAEYAHQRLVQFFDAEQAARSGDALYGRVHWLAAPLTLSLEGKHYRAFYPLKGNIDLGRAREFAPVQYNAPPTTEAVFVDTEFEEFNTCVSGGRAKLDVELTSRHSLFAWVGRYNTWGESAAAGSCKTEDENLNRVWDFAQGAEMRSVSGASYGNASFGTRFDSAERELLDSDNRATHIFYRELYLRHDIVFGLFGDTSLQFQAWHRRRHQTLGGPSEPWLQGQTTTALQWGRHWNFAFGFEYDQNPAFPDLYFNTQARYDFDSGSVTLFGGQRQGGLRCVSGVCRVFPPFEGARLDVALRF